MFVGGLKRQSATTDDNGIFHTRDPGLRGGRLLRGLGERFNSARRQDHLDTVSSGGKGLVHVRLRVGVGPGRGVIV